MTIDVTELFNDPDFAVCFKVLRRRETVSQEDGISRTEEEEWDATGSIISIDPKKLVTDPDSRSTYKAIQISTIFRLRSAVDGYQPDVVVWKGERFTIFDLKDHTNWGGGWIKARALSMNASTKPAEMPNDGY